MDDYRKVDAKYHLSDFSKPYALAGCTCIAKVQKWAKRWIKPDESIDFVFEDGDADKGDLMRAVKAHFAITPKFLPKEKCVAFQAADLLAYEHLRVNVKICESKTGKVFDHKLRFPLMSLSQIPGGRSGSDWGVHMEDDMTESCIRDSVPMRSAT
jgi:hypothetical protein